MRTPCRPAGAGFPVAVFTIFPELVDSYTTGSILGRARRSGALELSIHDLRDGAVDAHRSVDDSPFGGGAGMILAPTPVFSVVEERSPPRPLFLLRPGGRRFDQAFAEELALEPTGFSLLCGRYEGVDERIAERLVDGEISIGDYVLAGGELAALVVIEAVARLLPGVLGNDVSKQEESFSHGLLEYPQYTRPASFRGEDVPDVLRSGDHGAISAWREAAALARTIERRPDLIEARGGLSTAEVHLLEKHGYPLGAARAAGVASREPAAGAAPEEQVQP